MKKMIATAVIAAMLVLLLSSAVFAAGDTLVILGNSATVKTGEVAIITLTVDQNPGFMGMIFYPVIKDANGNRLNWAWAAELTNPDMDFDLDQGKIMMLTADDDCAAVGELMDVSFYVPSGAAPGVYTVVFMVSEGECLNAEFDEVSVSLPTVTITVTSTAAAGCRHQNTTSVPGKDPTCIDDGYTAGIYCNDCLTFVSGHSKLETSGHNYEVSDEAVRCDEEGHKTYTCTGCGDSYTIPVAAQGHSFTNYVSNNDATCTEDGTEKAKCDHCEATFERTAEGSALGHTAMVVVGYPATCTTDGLSDGKCCSVCGEILVAQEETAALGHTEEVIPAVEATCAKTGLTEGKKCSVCGEILVAQETVVANDAHSYRVEVTKEATETEEGEKTYTCEICGNVRVEKTGKLQVIGKVESSEGNVKVEIDNNSTADIDPNTELVVKEVKVETVIDTTAQTNIQQKVDAKAEVLAVYDITLMLNDVAIQPGGEVKVTIPAPAEAGKNDTLVVVYVDNNGNVTPCQTVRNADGTLTFVTDHFSYYAVVSISSGNTGLIIGIVVAVCAAAAAAFIFLKKKRT